jgi:hypothetical protein
MSTPAELASLPEPAPQAFDAARALAAIERIASQPEKFRTLLKGLGAEAFSRTYREGGWDVAQIVHHVADSHLHSYLRCKYALCETDPVIHPYEENDWVLTPDCDPEAVDEALALLDALHRKWTRLFRGLDEAGWNRSFIPDRARTTDFTSRSRSTRGTATGTWPRLRWRWGGMFGLPPKSLEADQFPVGSFQITSSSTRP